MRMGYRGKKVDGMDCLAMYHMTRDAVEYCRGGNGSLFLEVKTYRYRGHSMSDPQKYRTKEEVSHYEEHDPIGRLEKVLREKKVLDDAKVAAMNAEIHERVEKAHEVADAAPFPPSEDIWKDVYAMPFGAYLER